MAWRRVKLREISQIVGGATPTTKDPFNWDGDIAWITPKDLTTLNGRFISRGERSITEQGYKSCSCKLMPKGSILFSSRAPIGYVAIAQGEVCTNQGFKSLVVNPERVDNMFMYYLLVYNKKKIEGLGSGTTFIEVSGKVMSNVEVDIPPPPEQRRIAGILSSLDDKIECNQRICRNLEEQAQALFKHWFIDFTPFRNTPFIDSPLGPIPPNWQVRKAENIYTINIGKTPPRAERQWFSGNKSGNKIWVSISDMGSCGTFINNSSEYLTPAAQQKFNVAMVPASTILLSFKLTVGRVAIAESELTTNEAIARFILPKSNYREFTYLYLKQYKYESLGSTSSIATAVNSKIIKAMPLLLPPENVLNAFSDATRSLFDKINTLNRESTRLATLRDTLLPKLMSGEIKG